MNEESETWNNKDKLGMAPDTPVQAWVLSQGGLWVLVTRALACHLLAEITHSEKEKEQASERAREREREREREGERERETERQGTGTWPTAHDGQLFNSSKFINFSASPFPRGTWGAPRWM
jgi:hypothetical protein